MQKAWNIPNLPVYSLVTTNNGLSNMNICTYVSAISMKPKLYAIAVYENTKTLTNLENSEYVVLQLLDHSHFNLVNVLGQKTGFEYDKIKYLEKKGLLETWMNFPVLKNTSAKILLKKMTFLRTGDHDLYVFEAIKSCAIHKNYLSLEVLREKKIIRG